MATSRLRAKAQRTGYYIVVINGNNMEEKISFKSDGFKLQGLLHSAGEKGVVVTHPHPLYGGNMYNPVVETITQAFQHQGYTTLRFDFRGVGSSQGTYDKGTGEKRDTCRALAYLAQINVDKICLAGYSFGAWVNAQILPGDAPVTEMTMVSPPVAFIDFEPIQEMTTLKLVVTGSRDDIAPAHMIRERLPSWNPAARFEIIPGADHFFSGYADILASTLMAHL
jgi:alpha/beta superfamily hydrolase